MARLGEQLSQQRLKELVCYDPESGVFTWLVERPNITRGSVAGCLSKHGYVVISVLGKKHMAHRLAWLYVHGKWPEFGIDHKNGVKTDNSITNLRDVPHVVNMHNRHDVPKHNTSGFAGVYHKRGRNKWMAIITDQGKRRFLGYFDRFEDAVEARKEAERLLWCAPSGNTSRQTL